MLESSESKVSFIYFGSLTVIEVATALSVTPAHATSDSRSTPEHTSMPSLPFEG
jgi:hypothetical protein